MRNLGRVILFLLVSQLGLYASVKASVEPRTAYKGEMITYKLTMSGKDIQRPILSDICGNEILATGSQTSIESINGALSKSYILSFEFMPKESCIIEPVAVEIDGKEEYSNSVELFVKEPTQDKDAPFLLALISSKNELYVGEPFLLTLTLKQSLRTQAVDSQFIAPDFKGFWVKSEGKAQRVESDEHITTTVVYKLSPQREGNLSIEPAQLRVASRAASRSSWGVMVPELKWRSYYSNQEHFSVKALPNDASLIGDFRLNVEAQKREINPNEALNITITVEGEGNLEDIKSFKPYVPNVNIFDEKIVIHEDKLTQKLAFVSDVNFSVPAFELIFFDTKTQKLKKITTQPIEIKVNAASKTQELIVQRDEQSANAVLQTQEIRGESEQNLFVVAFAFALGVVVGLFIMLLKPLKYFKRKKSIHLQDEKILLIKLLPYKEDVEVQKIMDVLEKNIYTKNKEQVDKKLLKEILQRYKIS
jgi:hypothetical protein